MTNRELPELRDFIYMDVERVKSLLAQLDRGLLSERADSSGSSTSAGGKAGISIPALVEIGGTGQYVATDQATETRTLHDFVFNEVEEKLLEIGRIRSLPEDFSGARLLSDEVRSTLSPVEYVRVRGQVRLSDYGYMVSLLQNVNDIIAASTELSFQGRIESATGNQVNLVRGEMQRLIAGKKLDEKTIKNLTKIFDIFLRDRLVIRAIPFPEDANIRVVGPLQRGLMRESLDDIRFKFGSAPAEEWTIFGQIAAVPQESESAENLELRFSNDLEQAIQDLFSSIRPVENMFGVRYPEIAITPIAVYRG